MAKLEIIKKAIETDVTESDGSETYRYVIIQSGPTAGEDEWSFEINDSEPNKVFAFHNVKGGYEGDVDFGSVIEQKDNDGKEMDKAEKAALFLALYAFHADADDVPYDDVRRTLDKVTVTVKADQ